MKNDMEVLQEALKQLSNKYNNSLNAKDMILAEKYHNLAYSLYTAKKNTYYAIENFKKLIKHL
jgi:hypothetical protein